MNISIGALANATGVPANTIRTWERRYGFPVASRTAGGQRVYDPDCVEQVLLVARAIARGHRPAQLFSASIAELRSLGSAVLPGDHAARPSPAPGTRSLPDDVDVWVQHAAALDGDSLKRAFRSRLANLGMEAFLAAWVGPFLGALGEAWVAGRIQPFHEHFATERLGEFLANTWRPLAESNSGPVAVLATLPAERHGLGLHLAACLTASAGWRIVFLGVETPAPDIDACARQVGARAVLVSVSSASSPGQIEWDLAALRARLPSSVLLVVGGAGAPSDPGGNTRVWMGLQGFSTWLSDQTSTDPLHDNQPRPAG